MNETEDDSMRWGCLLLGIFIGAIGMFFLLVGFGVI